MELQQQELCYLSHIEDTAPSECLLEVSEELYCVMWRKSEKVLFTHTREKAKKSASGVSNDTEDFLPLRFMSFLLPNLPKFKKKSCLASIVAIVMSMNVLFDSIFRIGLLVLLWIRQKHVSIESAIFHLPYVLRPFLWIVLAYRMTSLQRITTHVTRLMSQRQNKRKKSRWCNTSLMLIIGAMNYPLIFTLIIIYLQHAEGSTPKWLQYYFLNENFGQSVFSVITMEFLIFFLTMLRLSAQTLMFNGFAIFYVDICGFLRSLLSDLNAELNRERPSPHTCGDDGKRILSKYEALKEAVQNVEDVLSLPLFLLTAESSMLVFTFLSMSLGFSKLCDAISRCVHVYCVNLVRICGHVAVMHAAAEVHTEGENMRKRLRLNAARFNWRVDHVTSYTDIVCRSPFVFTGWKLFEFTRGFILASAGTILTFSILILQLKPEEKPLF